MSGEGEVLEQMKLDGEQKVRAGERRTAWRRLR